MPFSSRARQLSLGLVLLGATAGTVLLTQKLHHLWVFARAGTAYSAKVLCSGVLMAGLDRERLEQEDLALGSRLIHAQINPQRNQVKATAIGGLISAIATRQANLGCSLNRAQQPPVMLTTSPRPSASTDPKGTKDPWPLNRDAASVPPVVDRLLLDHALDQAFAEPDPTRRPRRSRAVVVVQDGWVVAERYADGISPRTPLVGWSMTKSLFHALIGMAVADGFMALDQPAAVQEWSGRSNDPRALITLRQLLQMNSGLAFDELSRDLNSDLVRMLTQTDDMGTFAASQPLVRNPGERWAYASGTTAILSSALRHAINNDSQYWRFPYERLFQPLGMSSAVLETDPSGSFVGSSFGWASGRDWARFGLLYLNKGIWEGQQILPIGWTEQAREISRGSKRAYGSHWWVNQGRRHQDLPRNSYSAEGFEGQLLLIAPSHNAVIVRLGQTPDQSEFDRNAFASAVLEALKR